MALVLHQIAQTYGWGNLLVWYGVPYLWVNHWLGMFSILFLICHDMVADQSTQSRSHTYSTQISPLHTTDPTGWNFTAGAAATVDREFGFIGRSLFHDIIETHVLHHYISIIPFYHAKEATETVKQVMGHYYRSNTEESAIGFIKSLWTSARWCQWVEPSAGAEGLGKDVRFYSNRNGLGVSKTYEDGVTDTCRR